MADDRLEVLLYQAESRAEAAEAKLAEVREIVSTFVAVRGGGQGAQDLAEGIRQVLDRDKISSEEARRD